MNLQRTANSVLTVCLSQGDNRNPLADSEGYVIQLSKPYRLLGLPLPPNTNSELRVWESRSSSDSNHYLLCTGPILNENGERYQLTVGKRLD